MRASGPRSQGLCKKRSDVAAHIYSSALRPQHTVAGMMDCFTAFAKTRYRLCKERRDVAVHSP